MTKHHFLSVCIFFVFLFGGCQQQKDGNHISLENNKQSILSLTPRSDNKVLISDLAESINYVPLETTSDALIGSVDKIEMKDSLWYILDKKSNVIWCYSTEGKYIFKIDKKGQGPGEYIKIFDFDIDDKTGEIIILDRGSRKLFFYDNKGSFVKDLRIDLAASKFALVNDIFYFYTFGADTQMGKDKKDYGYNLFGVNREGEIICKQLQYNDVTDRSIGSNVFAKLNESILIHYAKNDTIYKLDDKGNIINKTIIDFGKSRVPIETIDSNDRFLFYLNNPSSAHVSTVFCSESFVYITYTYQKRVRFAIFDYNNKLHFNGSMLVNDIDGISFLNPTPHLVKMNTLYFVKEASDICNQELEKEKSFLSIKELSELKEDDNPVIVIFNLEPM